MGYTLSGPFDVFSSTGPCWEAVSGEAPQIHFKVNIAGLHCGAVESFNKMKLDCPLSFTQIGKTDLVIIPSVAPGPDGRYRTDPRLSRWLVEQYQSGAVLASICAGSFVLAESGLLDGKLATTHWAFRDLFRQNFPEVNLQADEVLTDDDRIICAGGSTSWQYLTSYLLERFAGSEMASQANRFFLLSGSFDKQTPCIPLAAPLAREDLVIRDVQEWMQQHLAEKDLLARAVLHSGLSERTFKRRFKNATGQAPLEYIQNVRVEKASGCWKTAIIQSWGFSKRSVTPKTVIFAACSSVRSVLPPTNTGVASACRTATETTARLWPTRIDASFSNGD
ncbi:MAG: DJ-1/PfpI family protein [Gammaproteobacteria bacterium]|nr:DJ-1/PfpI family protein [Gammaproteobacteria bacterium]